MKFIAFAAVGIVAVFTGLFIISSVKTSIGEFSLRRLERSERQEASVLGASAGAGMREDAIKNLVYPGQTTLSILKEIPDTSRFTELFTATNGAAFFAAPGMYTFFIPTDRAFEKLSRSAKEELASLNDAEVSRLIAYHIVPEKMISIGGQKAGFVSTLSGDALNVELDRKNIAIVENARIQAAYRVDNGIVYVIDHVLLPPVSRQSL